MARAKLTMGFNLNGIGGTESYISADLSNTTITPRLQDLIALRNQLLFETILWAGVRISNPDIKRGGTFYPPGTHYPFVPPTPPANPGQPLRVPGTGNRTLAASPTFAPDQARACLQYRVGYNDIRWVTRYLYGVPDALLTGDPQSVANGAVAGWQADFDAFRAELTSGRWFIRALQRINVPAGGVDPNIINIRNYVMSANPPTLMGIVINTADNPGIVARDFIRIYNSRRRGTDRVSYNGRYMVQSVVVSSGDGTTTLFLRGTEGGVPDSVKLPGQVGRLIYQYYPIQRVEPIRAGVHKRGKVLGVPVGRRQKRISLDP